MPMSDSYMFLSSRWMQFELYVLSFFFILVFIPGMVVMVFILFSLLVVHLYLINCLQVFALELLNIWSFKNVQPLTVISSICVNLLHSFVVISCFKQVSSYSKLPSVILFKSIDFKLYSPNTFDSWNQTIQFLLMGSFLNFRILWMCLFHWLLW